METNFGASGKLPGRCGIRGSYRNDRRAQTSHHRSGIFVKFRRSYVAKDAICEVHHEAYFSLLVSVQHESTGESCASLLGVSCLQCTHVMRCDPKGQPDWNYFNSILLWTWCSAMLTVIGAAWIFICAASISGGRRCSVLHLQNCSHCLEVVPEMYTFIYCIVFIITAYTYVNTNRRLSKLKAYLTIQLWLQAKCLICHYHVWWGQSEIKSVIKVTKRYQ